MFRVILGMFDFARATTVLSDKMIIVSILVITDYPTNQLVFYDVQCHQKELSGPDFMTTLRVCHGSFASLMLSVFFLCL